MPEMTIDIGGRQFRVACQPGEEDQLLRAAELLDAEARQLQDAIGRVPEARMLLMAGLMLADKAMSAADAADTADSRVRQLQDQLRRAEARSQQAAAADGADALKAELDALRAEHKAALGLLTLATEQIERVAARAGG
jgi:cell division protein ZapA